MSKQDNRFNFFVDNVTFEKGSDSAGEEVMKIKGIASTSDVDSDGESLIPAGFDCGPFLKSGFINWNHQSNRYSSSVIGEPQICRVINNGHALEVEGFLYPDREEAREVWKLAKSLSKNSKTRRLGFSIEGRATERDPINSKVITKAVITGLAVTASPKNPRSIFDIVKGSYDEAFTSYNQENPDLEDEEDEETKKSMGVAAIAPTMPESVEKNPKIKTPLEERELKKSEVIERIGQRFSGLNQNTTIQIYKFINKVQSYLQHPNIMEETITKSFAILESNLVDSLFDQIEKGNKVEPVATAEAVEETIEKSESATEVTEVVSEETIEKSFDATEFATAELTGNNELTKSDLVVSLIRKGVDYDSAHATANAAIAKFKEIGKEAIGDEQEEEVGETSKEGAITEDVEKKVIKKSIEESEEDIKKSIEADLIKSIGESEIKTKEFTKEIFKGFVSELNTRNTNFVEFVKGIQSEVVTLKSEKEALAVQNDELKKSLEAENNDLKKSFASLVKQFETFVSTPVQPKSVTTENFKPRFPSETEKIEKGEKVDGLTEISINDPKSNVMLKDVLADHIKKSNGPLSPLEQDAVRAFTLGNLVTKPIADIFKSRGLIVTE